MTSDYFCF